MTRIGITGHQKIPAEALDHVTRGLRDCLARVFPPRVGYSSLAAGADQLFARALLEAGGRLVAVIPCRGYEAVLADPADLAAYRDLLAQAGEVVTLDWPRPCDEAYMAAGEYVVRHADLMIAVWDGRDALSLGGTADAVWHAWDCGVPVVNLWPRGVVR